MFPLPSFSFFSNPLFSGFCPSLCVCSFQGHPSLLNPMRSFMPSFPAGMVPLSTVSLSPLRFSSYHPLSLEHFTHMPSARGYLGSPWLNPGLQSVPYALSSWDLIHCRGFNCLLRADNPVKASQILPTFFEHQPLSQAVTCS